MKSEEELHLMMHEAGYPEEECTAFSKQSMVKMLVKIEIQYATTSSMWLDEPTCACGEENSISHC